MRIGPYEVLEEIGRGGAGVVYRARGPDGRIVALKLLRASPPGSRERFAREERLLAALGEKEGFVTLLASGDSPQGPWLAMPFVAGGTLRARLRGGAFAPEDAVRIVATLAAAAGRAHARGIVHRDLKPENILFTEEGRPLIADLGLAKHFEAEAPGASRSVALSRTSDSRGTIGYMAPEQIQGSRDAKPPADVFALGAILFECLAGEPAFTGSSATEVLVALARAEVRPLRAISRRIPRWLEQVTRRALAKDPAERFPDGAALAAALAAGPPRSRAGTIAKGAGVLAVALALLAGAALLVPGLRGKEASAPDPLLEAGRLFDAAHDDDSWLATARQYEAARRAQPGAALAPPDERRRLAALALAGSPDLARLAREAASRDPAIDRAVRALYERALAEPAPIASLRALVPFAPPVELRKRVASEWLAVAPPPASELRAFWLEVLKEVAGLGGAADRSKRVGALVVRLSGSFDAFGRALALDPDMDPFPKRMGPFFTVVRYLLTRIRTDGESVPAAVWERATEPVRDHPIGILARVCVAREAKAPPVTVRDLARLAVPGLERARERTMHVRALAREIVNTLTFVSPGEDAAFQDLVRAARIADFVQSWGDLVRRAKDLGRSDPEYGRRQGEAEGCPGSVWEPGFFDPDDEDPR